MSEHEKKKQDLEIAKLEAELRSAKLDRYFRPFQLLTPVLLALGVYLLVQQPQVEEKESSACIDQVRFVLDFSNDTDASPELLRGVLENMSYQCEAAKVTADGILAETEARQSLQEADAVLSSGRDYLELNLNAVSDADSLCTLNEVVPILPLYGRAEVVLGELQRNVLQLERAIADNAVEMAAEEPTGRGPKWMQLRAERDDLSGRLQEVQGQMAERERELEQLGTLSVIATNFCQ